MAHSSQGLSPWVSWPKQVMNQHQQIDALLYELTNRDLQIKVMNEELNSLLTEIQNLRCALSLYESTIAALREREAGLVEELVTLQGRIVELERGSR